MVARGFSAAGYKYLVVDDCWMDRKRTSENKLQGDIQRFPSGIPDVAQYVSIIIIQQIQQKLRYCWNSLRYDSLLIAVDCCNPEYVQFISLT